MMQPEPTDEECRNLATFYRERALAAIDDEIHVALLEIAESYGILALQLEWLQKVRERKPPEPTPLPVTARRSGR